MGSEGGTEEGTEGEERAGTWAPEGVGQRADHRHLVRGAAVRDARKTSSLRLSQRPSAAGGAGWNITATHPAKALPAQWKKW